MICISIETGELRNFDKVPVPKGNPIPLCSPIGNHDIGAKLFKPEPIYKREVTYDANNKRHTANVKIGETVGYPSIARQLSIVYPISEVEVKELLEPLFKLRLMKIYIFLKSHSLGIKEEAFFEEKYGIKNGWMASGNGSDAAPSFDAVNRILKEKGSPWRVRTERLFVTRTLNPDA